MIFTGSFGAKGLPYLYYLQVNERVGISPVKLYEKGTMEDKNPWNGYGKPSLHILNLSNVQM